jgi:hypothetical protein
MLLTLRIALLRRYIAHTHSSSLLVLLLRLLLHATVTAIQMDLMEKMSTELGWTAWNCSEGACLTSCQSLRKSVWDAITAWHLMHNSQRHRIDIHAVQFYRLNYDRLDCVRAWAKPLGANWQKRYSEGWLALWFGCLFAAFFQISAVGLKTS